MKKNLIIQKVVFLLTLLFLFPTKQVFAESVKKNKGRKAFKLPALEVPEDNRIKGHYVQVKGTKMYYVEQGHGHPILFVHGVPTSSYIWRNIIPTVSKYGRAIALDLVGMGRSGKPDISYTFHDQYRYLKGFIHQLGLSNITLVLHDWGAGLGFYYASQHPTNVKRIAFLEGALPPFLPQPSYSAMGPLGKTFKALRDPVQGPQLAVEKNMFIEGMLPDLTNRVLGKTAMKEYRLPYIHSKDRKPLLIWPRQIPIEGKPAEMVKVMNHIKRFMKATHISILLLYAEPGVLVGKETVKWYTQHMQNVETSFVGQGLHFLQEDHPVAISKAISDWLRRHQKYARKK